MQVELLRISCQPKEQMDGFERQGPDGKPLNREMWLRAVFGQRIDFVHRKEQFHYLPAPDLTDGRETPRLIAGRVGRRVSVEENAPPDKGLEPVVRPAWHSARIFIDPKSHGDGQKVAFELRGDIGLPVAIFETLAWAISVRSDEPYEIEAHPIVEKETFWSFVAENRQVVEVEFEFLAPNMFGAASDLDKDLKDIQAHIKSRKTKVAFQSKDGLQLADKRIHEAVDYVARGTGTVKARAKNNRRYNSAKKPKKIKIDDDSSSSIFSLIAKLFKDIFKE